MTRHRISSISSFPTSDDIVSSGVECAFRLCTAEQSIGMNQSFFINMLRSQNMLLGVMGMHGG
jgi:hypothetical protein